MLGSPYGAWNDYYMYNNYSKWLTLSPGAISWSCLDIMSMSTLRSVV